MARTKVPAAKPLLGTRRSARLSADKATPPPSQSSPPAKRHRSGRLSALSPPSAASDSDTDPDADRSGATTGAPVIRRIPSTSPTCSCVPALPMENFIKPPPNTKLPSERQTSTPENTNSERDLERDESINTSSGREVANAEGAAGDLTHNTSHDLEEIYNSNQDIPDGLIPEDVTASEASTSNLSLSSTFAPVGTLTESVPIEIDDAQSTRRVSQPAPRSPLSPSSRQKVAKSPPRKESSSPLLPEKTRSQLTILKKIKRRARAAATLALPVTLALACGATIAAIGAPGVAMAGRHLKGTEATGLDLTCHPTLAHPMRDLFTLSARALPAPSRLRPPGCHRLETLIVPPPIHLSPPVTSSSHVQTWR